MSEIRSTWFVVDGVVMRGDLLPKRHAITGKVTAARQEIREQMLAARKR